MDTDETFPLHVEEERDDTPPNPPPSATDEAYKTAQQHEFQEYSNFSQLNHDHGHKLADEHNEHHRPSFKCSPHACPSIPPQPPLNHDDRSSSSFSSMTRLPSVASIFDYEIVQGLLKPGVVKTEMEAFVPVDGLVAPEKKRQEFHDYLHKKGFLTGIAKVLIALYDEPELPPKDTVNEYIAKCLGFHLTAKTELAEKKSYLSMLQQRIHKLEVENDWIRRHLDNYEATETPLDIVDPESLPPIKYLDKGQNQLSPLDENDCY